MRIGKMLTVGAVIGRPYSRGFLMLLALLLACSSFAQEKKQFRVCADPENLPFSNRKLEGFENKIADLVAKEFGASPTYIWWGQRRGFIRNTMFATLKEQRCDIVIGVPEGYDLVLPTKPYYRSTYVFVYPKGKGLQIRSLDDPILNFINIGVPTDIYTLSLPDAPPSSPASAAASA